jgi:soluble lytic murein transglycosylase-like protein
MTNSRSEPTIRRMSRQTDPSSGCLSGFLIPPLIALCFGLVLAFATNSLNFADSQPEAAAQNESVDSYTYTGNPTGDGTLAPLFTPEIQYWSADIVRWAASHSLDPNLVATVMQIESCGNPDARSSAGASGLFQVMPFHFIVSENAYDPDTNALRGMSYLAKSLQRAGGDARQALAGYNGGIGVIGRAESSWPAETIRYAYWGSGIYADAVQNAGESARLNEWLTAGGAGLCRKAHERLGLSSDSN